MTLLTDPGLKLNSASAAPVIRAGVQRRPAFGISVGAVPNPASAGPQILAAMRTINAPGDTTVRTSGGGTGVSTSGFTLLAGNRLLVLSSGVLTALAPNP